MTSFPPCPDGSTVGFVVVGGRPAGHSAAACYREHVGGSRVVIISADGDAPYQRPPLSKDFLRGESEESALPMESLDFYGENRIELWLAESVVELDLTSMALTTAANRELSFDSCVLATGNQPATLPVPGGDHPDVLRLRFLQDARMSHSEPGALRGDHRIRLHRL